MRHVVYFARRASDGLIKIGVTTQLWNRIANLGYDKRYGGVELLAHISVRMLADEGRFHNMFVPLHRGGEWFEPAPDLLAVIERVREGAFSLDELPPGPSKIHGDLIRAGWARSPHRKAA